MQAIGEASSGTGVCEGEFKSWQVYFFVQFCYEPKNALKNEVYLETVSKKVFSVF